MRATLERELKLDVDPSFALPDLPGSPLEERVFTSTYYDTSARSLGRAGITLRRRVENGTSLWQLKLPRGGLARAELEERGGPDGPPPALARLLVAHGRHGALEKVATLRTRRSGLRVRDAARPVAEVTIDEVTVLTGGESGGFTEVEVELVDTGNDGDLASLGEALLAAGARRGSAESKLMRVLDLPKQEGPDPSAPLEVHLRHALARQIDAIERHDPGVRLGTDPEDLHQLRVATRRARALVRATRPLLGDRLQPLAAELKELGRLLGDVRDLDVLIHHLRGEVAQLDQDEEAGNSIVAALGAEREARREALLEKLGAPSYLTLLDDFQNAVDSLGPLAGDDGSRAIAREALRKLRRAAAALPDEPSDVELHALRIKAKRARYAAELAALGGSKSAARTVAAFKQLQDVIGEHQDAVVAEARLRQVAGPATAVAAGRLIERERERKAQMRKRYPDALRIALRRGRKAFG